MLGDVSEGHQGFLESPVVPWIGKGAGCSGVVGEHTDPHCGHARGVFMTDKETPWTYTRTSQLGFGSGCKHPQHPL